jgi:YesN/AraC family two-component response regulator
VRGPHWQHLRGSNGVEAIKVLEANHIDALFTDINMPVMTGTQLLREIGSTRDTTT